VPIPGSEQESLFKQYLGLFPGRGNSLLRKVGGGQFRRMSQYHYLSDDEIRESLSNDPSYVRACCLDTKTSFVVVGIPATSRYNDTAQFARLLDALTSCGFKPKSYKAADCDDIQIYLSFTESVDSSAVQKKLSSQLMHLGFEVSPDTLIVHSIDQAFPLPLQAGFCWLNDNLTIKLRREDISLESALALFVADLSRSAVPPAILLDAVIAPPAVQDKRELLIEEIGPAEPIFFDVPEDHWSNILSSDAEPITAPFELELTDLLPLDTDDLCTAVADVEPVEQINLDVQGPIIFDPVLVDAPPTEPELPPFDPVARAPDEAEVSSTGPPAINIFDCPGGTEIGAQLLLFPVPGPSPADDESRLQRRRGRRARSDPDAELALPPTDDNKVFSDLNYVELKIPFPDPGGE